MMAFFSTVHRVGAGVLRNRGAEGAVQSPSETLGFHICC